VYESRSLRIHSTNFASRSDIVQKLDTRPPIVGITDRAKARIEFFLKQTPHNSDGVAYIPVIDGGGSKISKIEGGEEKVLWEHSPPILGFNLVNDILNADVFIIDGLRLAFMFTEEQKERLREKILDFENNVFVFIQA
jgi:hypothetical protein